MSIQKKSRLTFGLIVDCISGWEEAIYYQSSILSGVNDFAEENNINIFCFVTGRIHATREWEKMRNILFDMINSKNLDGLIILTASIGFNPNEQSTLDFIKKFGDIPIVTINSGLNSYPGVSIDNYTGMKRVIDHLIEVHGCSKIAFIKGPVGNNEADLRFEAYRESLKSHNISFNEDLIFQDTLEFNYFSGNLAVRAYLDERKVAFDAIAASNDNMAIGALLELNSRNCEVQIPITGFDNSDTGKNFSLTTVNQSFYDQAKATAKKLMDIIMEKKTPMQEELPAELIIRSSCGCTPDSIKGTINTHYNSKSVSTAYSFESIMENIMQALSKLDLSIPAKHKERLRELEENAIISLYNEICTKQKENFLNSWEKIIFWATIYKIDLFFLDEILTELRKKFLPFLSDISEIEKAEGLFHSARIQVVEAIRRTEGSCLVFNYIHSQGLGVFGENLTSSFDFDQQVEIIASELPKCGINKGLISLYEDPANPLGYSRLAVAFNENGMVNLNKNKLLFHTRDLLPRFAAKMLKASRFTLIVEALFHGDTHLGVALLQLGSESLKTMETIRYRLSFSFKSALLLDKIQKQTQNLEKQVRARTKQLTHANKQLENEIATRKKVEEQLKSALDDLKLYNKKLHYQSLRDELTGLYNRRGFMTLGIQHYQYAKNSQKSFLILYADMDNLKYINDNFGHKEGDFAIRKTSEILSRSFRNMDIVARLSGDEFTILMVDAIPRDFIEFKKRLASSFENYNKTSGKPYKLAISIGSSHFDPKAPIMFDDLLLRADKALYSQKKLKKNKGNLLT